MAIRIQCFVRMRRAKRLMLQKMKEVVQKFIDQNTGLPYWYNPRSGKTSWHKPKLLQEEDVEEAVAVAEPDVECVMTHRSICASVHVWCTADNGLPCLCNAGM